MKKFGTGRCANRAHCMQEDPQLERCAGKVNCLDWAPSGLKVRHDEGCDGNCGIVFQCPGCRHVFGACLGMGSTDYCNDCAYDEVSHG